mgnify:CR=1 FL=1
MAKSIVSIVRSGQSAQVDVAEATRKALGLIGGLDDIVRPGALVLLNPNVVAAPSSQHSGATTNPDVVRAIADLVREKGGRPVIAESSAVGVDTEVAYAAAGYAALREAGYEVVDLKRTPSVKVPVANGKVIKTMLTYELVTKADAIVSVPVMKTHDQTEATLSLKNLKGLLDDRDKKRLHKLGVFQGVVDLVATLRPALAVIDGTWAQEGLGPVYGHTVQMNLVLASRDLVAADAVAAQVMGFAPEELLITRYAAERGLGNAASEGIEVVGEPIAKVQRRFLRSVEDHQYDIADFTIVHAEGTCTGCRNTVISVLYDLKNADQLHLAEGLTILTSNAAVPSGRDPAKVIAVGNCVPPRRRGTRFAPGCPPNNVWIVQQIVGDRGQVRRTYATEEKPTD